MRTKYTVLTAIDQEVEKNGAEKLVMFYVRLRTYKTSVVMI